MCEVPLYCRLSEAELFKALPLSLSHTHALTLSISNTRTLRHSLTHSRSLHFSLSSVLSLALSLTHTLTRVCCRLSEAELLKALVSLDADARPLVFASLPAPDRSTPNLGIEGIFCNNP